jgi:hypothetical protein
MPSYLYTGSGTRSYMDYVDTATDRMLVAEPGWQGEMRATWDKLPVPPADGFWEVIESPAEAEAAVEAPPAVTAAKGKGAKPA